MSEDIRTAFTCNVCGEELEPKGDVIHAHFEAMHKNHIPDEGKMVGEKTNETLVWIGDGASAAEPWFIDTISGVLRRGKLKPVDENCLYKPVLTIGSFKEDRSQILVGVYDDVLCIFNKDNLKLTQMGDKDKVYRIEDYRYGDEGNYE